MNAWDYEGCIACGVIEAWMKDGLCWDCYEAKAKELLDSIKVYK